AAHADDPLPLPSMQAPRRGRPWTNGGGRPRPAAALLPRAQGALRPGAADHPPRPAPPPRGQASPRPRLDPRGPDAAALVADVAARLTRQPGEHGRVRPVHRVAGESLQEFTLPKHGVVRTIALTDPARERLLSLPRESEFAFTTLCGSHYRPSSRAFHW